MENSRNNQAIVNFENSRLLVKEIEEKLNSLSDIAWQGNVEILKETGEKLKQYSSKLNLDLNMFRDIGSSQEMELSNIKKEYENKKQEMIRAERNVSSSKNALQHNLNEHSAIDKESCKKKIGNTFLNKSIFKGFLIGIILLCIDILIVAIFYKSGGIFDTLISIPLSIIINIPLLALNAVAGFPMEEWSGIYPTLMGFITKSIHNIAGIDFRPGWSAALILLICTMAGYLIGKIRTSKRIQEEYKRSKDKAIELEAYWKQQVNDSEINWTQLREKYTTIEFQIKELEDRCNMFSARIEELSSLKKRTDQMQFQIQNRLASIMAEEEARRRAEEEARRRAEEEARRRAEEEARRRAEEEARRRAEEEARRRAEEQRIFATQVEAYSEKAILSSKNFRDLVTYTADIFDKAIDACKPKNSDPNICAYLALTVYASGVQYQYTRPEKAVTDYAKNDDDKYIFKENGKTDLNLDTEKHGFAWALSTLCIKEMQDRHPEGTVKALRYGNSVKLTYTGRNPGYVAPQKWVYQ